MSGVWKKPSRELSIPGPIQASTNLQAQEVPQAPQTPIAEPARAPQAALTPIQPVGEGRRRVAAGGLARAEVGGVAVDIDARVLRTTHRVLPLQLTVDKDVNYWFRAEALRRYDHRLGHHKLSDLFLLCIEAYREKHGV